MTAERPRAIVVDDEFLIVELLSMMLEDMEVEVCASADNADEAIIIAERHRPRIVLMDVRLKGRKDGVEAARVIKQNLDTSVIFITGSREPATVERLERHHPAAILFKPIGFEQLKKVVRRVVG
jgi:two-component system, response regulator PdtaR